jgi:hypothetical protein
VWLRFCKAQAVVLVAGIAGQAARLPSFGNRQPQTHLRNFKKTPRSAEAIPATCTRNAKEIRVMPK